MNYLRYLLILLLSLKSVPAGAQQVPVSIHVAYQGRALELQKEYRGGQDTVRFEKIRFYVSDFCLLYQREVVARDQSAVHLIDLADKASNRWNINVPLRQQYDEIRLLIGTDSLSNVSGVQAGALDPANGMYWSWQSGYINIKVEGYSSRSPTRKHKFQYHLGGYQGVNATQRLWSVKVKPDMDLALVLELGQWIEEIFVEKTFEIMSPSETSARLSTRFAQLISLQQ